MLPEYLSDDTVGIKMDDIYGKIFGHNFCFPSIITIKKIEKKGCFIVFLCRYKRILIPFALVFPASEHKQCIQESNL